jgi:predicted nucleic acid-binding protein
LVVEKAPPSTPQLPFPLDAGETEAIGLALATQADVVLMDERRGRQAARHHGLAVGGVLGELLHARQTGMLPNLRSEINRLRSEAGFFVDAEIEQFILSQVGD